MGSIQSIILAATESANIETGIEAVLEPREEHHSFGVHYFAVGVAAVHFGWRLINRRQ